MPQPSFQTAREVMEKLVSPLEVLGNLVYLTMEDPEASDRIRSYMQLAETQVEAIRQITQPEWQQPQEALPPVSALRAA